MLRFWAEIQVGRRDMPEPTLQPGENAPHVGLSHEVTRYLFALRERGQQIAKLFFQEPA